MSKFSNVQIFASQYKIQKRPIELLELEEFTSYSKGYRLLKTKSPFSKIKKETGSYVFIHNKRKYPFQVLSDRTLQTFDKEILKNPKKREMESLRRTVKLACSLDLVNPEVIMGNSLAGTLEGIILFQDKQQEKVIDYASNIMMNKDDYDELFQFQELNRVDKPDLNQIYYLMTKLNMYDYMYEFLLFGKEILGEITRHDEFKYLGRKYQEEGMNTRNYSWFGPNQDSLFFQPEDVENKKYDNLIDELKSFTENPKNLTTHISYDEKKGTYRLKEKSFGGCEFGLLSDIIAEEDVRSQLLSDERYGKCHKNSIRVAGGFAQVEQSPIIVVGGKVKINEQDYLYHSWVELEERKIVLDFNSNIIMSKEKYYKLFEAQAVSKTPISNMEEAIEWIEEYAKLGLEPIYLTYFGVEIMNDLKKNENILTKKQVN